MTVVDTEVDRVVEFDELRVVVRDDDALDAVLLAEVERVVEFDEEIEVEADVGFGPEGL